MREYISCFLIFSNLKWDASIVEADTPDHYTDTMDLNIPTWQLVQCRRETNGEKNDKNIVSHLCHISTLCDDRFLVII